jgi:GntR family transcriptional regulator/MocR family aminotransferase
VPVDTQGIRVAEGVRRAPHAALAFVTPAHQFPLGVALSPGRREELLRWAARTGAYILEDDYDWACLEKTDTNSGGFDVF